MKVDVSLTSATLTYEQFLDECHAAAQAAAQAAGMTGKLKVTILWKEFAKAAVEVTEE